MALLVAFGLMNVIAMVVLAGAVLVEEDLVWGPRFAGCWASPRFGSRSR